MSLVRRKLYGGHLEETDFAAILRDVQAGRLSDIQIAAFLSAGARNTAEKIGGVPDICGSLRIEIAVLANRQDLRHLNPQKIAPSFRQRRQQRRRLAHAGCCIASTIAER